MGEAARDDAEVVEVAEYLRESLAKMDAVITQLALDRQDIATRLAVLNASASQAVLDAAEDFDRRMAEGRAFDGAEEASTVLSDAAKRFAMP